MEIKHPNMLPRKKFFMPNIEDSEYSSKVYTKYPEKKSFTAFKEQQYFEQSSTNDQESPRFGACLVNCPRSLKKIVQTYRFVCYTFSGLVFEDRVEENSKIKQQQINKRKQAIYQGSFEPKTLDQFSRNGLSAASLGILAIGILVLSTYIVPLYITHFATNKPVKGITLNYEQGYNSSNNSNPDDEVQILHFFGLAQYQIAFGQLKPILSAVMDMVRF